MIIPAETIKLKDMKEYLLRSTEESDAEQLASFIYSPLFTALQEGGILMDDHAGGCVLYEKRDLVESIMAGNTV